MLYTNELDDTPGSEPPVQQVFQAYDQVNGCTGHQETGAPGRHGHRVMSRLQQEARLHSLHVTIDDHLRAGCGLILPDETARSAVRFAMAALRCHKAPGGRITGTMTDIGSAD